MCEPEIINSELEYEGYDDEGNMETSWSHIYNCHECNNNNCKYWKEYN